MAALHTVPISQVKKPVSPNIAGIAYGESPYNANINIMRGTQHTMRPQIFMRRALLSTLLIALFALLVQMVDAQNGYPIQNATYVNDFANLLSAQVGSRKKLANAVHSSDE